jgi:predicted transposase YbfD/YdcC
MEKLQRIVFLDYFDDLEDPRQCAKVLYPLDEILLLSLCGAISGCEDFTDIAEYGEEKLDFLRTLLPFTHGIPSHDTLNDLFRDLNAADFGKIFTAWTASLSAQVPTLVSIDGKTLRGSRDGAKGPLHLVSAWAGEQRRVLGQVATAEKSNEITAIPELLDMLMLKGAIITIDAMGCQKNIAEKIRARDADYILALKGNHGHLHDDVKTFFESDGGAALPTHVTTDADHGRIETRRYSMTDDIDWLIEGNPGWRDLYSIGRVENTCEKNGVTTRQVRFYLCSIAVNLLTFAGAVRGHWGIENSLHWVLDVTFREDLCRIRKDHAPQNFAVIRHAAINLINKNKGKRSVKTSRKKAGWNNAALLAILTS